MSGTKDGGKIYGVVCYKDNVEYFDCTAISDVLEFGWTAEPGSADAADEEVDSAMSMTTCGASFLAAMYALVF